MALWDDLRSYYEAKSAYDSWNVIDLTLGSEVSVTSYSDKFSGEYDKWHFGFGTNNANSYLKKSPGIPVAFANNMTFACWAKDVFPSGAKNLVTFSNGEVLIHVDSASNEIGVYDGAFFSSGVTYPYSSGWQHIAATYDNASGVTTFYLNGSAIGTVTRTLSFVALELIGGSDAFARQFASGLDDIIVWERKLSASEINEIYSISLGGASPFRKLIPGRQINDNNDEIGWLSSPLTNNFNKLNYHMNTVISSSASSSYSEDFESTAIGSLPAGWTTFGDQNWEVTGSDAHAGTKSAGSNPALNHNQSTSLAYTASLGSPQTLTFWWKVSSESGYDWLRFYIDGVQKDEISGTPAWAEKSYSLPAGSSVLKWTYSKDFVGDSGQDAAWIDDVNIGDPGGYSTPDGSGNDHDGTLYNITAADTGSYITLYSGSVAGGDATEFTASINFNGSTSKFDTGVTPNDVGIVSSNEKTIMLWASSSAWVDYKPFFSMGTNNTRQDFTLIQKTDGDIQLNVWGIGEDLTVTPASTTGWHHYACTYDNSANIISLYIDGQLAGSNALGGALNTSDANNILIGAGQHYWASHFFSGSIQEFSLFSSELSAENVFDVFSHQGQSILGFLSTGSQSLLTEVATAIHNAEDSSTIANLQGTTIHDAINSSEIATLHATAVANGPDISGSVADITGTVGLPATFDASPLGLSTSSVSFQWEWLSVPAGSSLSNQAFPLPDGAVNTYFNMVDNQGLWHFDGDALDSSGVGNNGVINGAPSTVAGKINDALDFNGSTDYVEIPDSPSLNSNIGTVACWVKFSSATSPMSVVSKNDVLSSGNGWHIYIDGNELAAQIKGTGTTTFNPSTGAINDNLWHHLALVFESNATSELYLDGRQVASNASTVSFNVSSEPLRIAKNVDAYWNEFNGTIDEVALWSRKLSSTEIADLYFLQSGSCASGSVGLGETFAFTPDVSGTYQVNLETVEGNYSASGHSYAFISAAPGPTGSLPVITASNPTLNLVESADFGYVFNTYRVPLLSVQRSRTVMEIPFKLGTKGEQSLRERTNQEFTGSA